MPEFGGGLAGINRRQRLGAIFNYRNNSTPGLNPLTLASQICLSHEWHIDSEGEKMVSGHA